MFDPLDTAELRETLVDVAAVRVRIPRLTLEFWVAMHAPMVQELEAENAETGATLPVLTVGELVALRGKSDAALRAALEVKRAFPGSRLLQ